MFTVKLVAEDEKRVELSHWDVVRVWKRDSELFNIFEDKHGATEDIQAYLVEEYPDGNESPTSEVKQLLAIHDDESVYITDDSGKTVYCLS